MDFLLILFLIVINGVFAMSEIAVVSSRKARLQKLADEGHAGADRALRLNADPERFLSTIQVGITSVGILSGALGNSVLTQPLAETIDGFEPLAPYAQGIALTATVVIITYLSVVVGELVPKRLALLRAESIAMLIAGPMRMLSRIAGPVVWILGASSTLLLQLMRAERSDEPPVSDDEIKVLMQQGAEAGVFHHEERAFVANVLRLDEQRVGEIMTPRVELYALDLSDDDVEIARTIVESPHSRIPVHREGLEHVLGFLRLGDLARSGLAATAGTVERLLQPALVIPESLTTVHLLEQFRRQRSSMALIVDEYGDLQGLVTLYDVLTAIVGNLPDEHDDEEPQAVRRDDGSWLVDGSLGIERFKALLGVAQDLPGEDDGDFHTLAGMVLHHLERIPRVGERFEADGLHYEIVDLDGNRIDKLIVTPLSEPEGEARAD